MTAARPADPALARQRLRLWLQMLKTVRSVETELRERLRHGFDITLARFDVLAMLHRSPEGLTMSALSQQLVVSNGNVTGIVDRLVVDGLVERHAVEGDRRASLVKVTEAGRAAMDEMAVEHLGWIDDLFVRVDEADAARAIAVMHDIRAGLKG